MNVLVDTSIWSLALRRKKTKSHSEFKPLVKELTELIQEDRAVIIGPVRQEILSGIPHQNQFDILKKKLSAFRELRIGSVDYESAAALFNKCRSQGIQGSHIDFLICAVALRNKISIFTIDKDFENYSNSLDEIITAFDLRVRKAGYERCASHRERVVRVCS